MSKHKTYIMIFAEVYPLYAAKAERKGIVCRVRVAELEEQAIRENRYLDKLIDQLAKYGLILITLNKQMLLHAQSIRFYR